MIGVRYFLLVYNRPEGRLVSLDEYAEQDAALEARFALEREHEGDRDLEIVVLGSDSLDTVKRTHRRYFESVEDMLRSAIGQ